jgi:hypothetical protein
MRGELLRLRLQAASSTARQIIPQASARSASTVSPSIASARARASPISRGRKKLAPESGTRPIFTNAWMNRALRPPARCRRPA